MWKHVRSIYENHILIYPDLYISCDDIISIDNVIYQITGITDNSDIYLQDDTNNKSIQSAHAFLQMLKNKNIKYIRNLHKECIDRNKKI